MQFGNNKFSNKVQTFYNLKEYTISLVKELIYIDDIESNYLQNEIDYSTFNQQEFDSVKICKYCNANLIILIMIDILFYMRFVIKKN